MISPLGIGLDLPTRLEEIRLLLVPLQKYSPGLVQVRRADHFDAITAGKGAAFLWCPWRGPLSHQPSKMDDRLHSLKRHEARVETAHHVKFFDGRIIFFAVFLPWSWNSGPAAFDELDSVRRKPQTPLVYRIQSAGRATDSGTEGGLVKGTRFSSGRPRPLDASEQDGGHASGKDTPTEVPASSLAIGRVR